eukprot:jgi/Ulvmu1/5386/UM022_0181.1
MHGCVITDSLPRIRPIERPRLCLCASARVKTKIPAVHWCPYTDPLLWKGNESATINESESFQQLSAPWKVMLLSDGSVTRHLKLMTGLEVAVECLEMRHLQQPELAPDVPPEFALLDPPIIRRQVLLRLHGQPGNEGDAAPLVYAASWWNATAVESYLKDSSLPIWASLSRERLELFRDIRDVYLGHCPDLEDVFQAKGPFWGRDYVFWHNKEPLTVIHEVFSSSLSQYLGSMGADSLGSSV